MKHRWSVAGSTEIRASPWVAWIIAVPSIALAIGTARDPAWHTLLEYRRDAIGADEWWRLLTGHLVHLSTTHATLDIAGLLLVAWIFGAALAPWQQWTTCVVAVALIDAALWTLHPEVDRYAGLSGVLHAWFAAGAIRWLAAQHDADDPRRQRRMRAWGAALLIGLGAKLWIEARHQAFWIDGDALRVVTAAHRWGALAGLCCGASLAWLSRRMPRVDAVRASPAR